MPHPLHRVLQISTVGLLLSFILSGCGGLSKNECRTADWRTIGYEDGSRGYPLSQIGKYRKDCADHSVTPNMASYKAGHQEGVKHYCQPRNGYHVGMRGSTYYNVCPQELNLAFLDAYDYGREVNSLSSKLKRKKAHRKRVIKRMKAIDDEILHKEQHMLAQNVPMAERVLLLKEIKDLMDEKAELDSTLHTIEHDVALLREDIKRLKEASPYS